LKSKEIVPRILLDTSFILPSLGIDLGGEVSQGLRRLAEIEAEIYYSRFSILESLWIAARLSMDRSFDGERFNLGLRSIIEGGRYRRVEEGSEIFVEALRLYMLGHRDIIDNILYASSTRLNLRLLTLDRELKRFVGERGLEDSIILPDQLTD